ncbi:MAG: hypothetical protein IT205_05635 [Fimbriimonadaceae bacterium]|nr:hypothetical protein [Fimbriimonadaceae bacterium]
MRYLWLVAVVCFIWGCGGNSGDGSPSLRATTITSTIEVEAIPRGGTPLEDLDVWTSAQTSDVSSTGTSSVVIYNEGPQYAEVQDPQGRPVLMGFLSPSSPNLSPRSTAIALAFLAVSGGWMKEAGRLTVLAELPTLPGFDALESAVATQLDADGYLNLDDKGFQSALSTVVLGAMKRGAIVEPTQGSGLSANTSVEGKLSFQNVYLRRVVLFMRRTGYLPAEGATVDEPDTPWTRIEMPVVARYGGITGTIDGYIKGEVAYSPVTSTPFDVPRFPADAKKTYYQVNAVGPGWEEGPYGVSIPQEQRDELLTLELKTMFLDAFLVLLANVALPLGGEQVDEYLQFMAGNAVITDIISNLRTTVPQVGELCGQGKYYDAFKTLATAAYTSNTILPLVGQLTLDFLQANSGLTNEDLESLHGGMKGILDKMGKIDVGFTLADSALLFHDFAASNKVEKFELKVGPGTITLQADRTTIQPTGTTKIKAIVQDRDPAGTYEFEWTVSPNSNYWVEDRHLVGTDDNPSGLLTTLEDEVNIRSLVTTNGEATVTCKAFRLDGGRRGVGDDDIVITFDTAAENILTTMNPTIQVSKVVKQLGDGGYAGYMTLWYVFPIHEDAFFMRVTGTYNGPAGGGVPYMRQWNEPRANPSVFIQNPQPELNIPPPSGSYKVYVRALWDGVVGGFSTEAAAQANLDSMAAGQLSFYNANYTTKIEQYLP